MATTRAEMINSIKQKIQKQRTDTLDVNNTREVLEELTNWVESSGGNTAGLDLTGATDSSTALQLLIDSSSNGDTIKIPEGKLKLDSQVNIDKELYIIADSTSVELAPSIIGFFIDSDNVIVKGFNFNCVSKTTEAITINSKNGFNVSECNFLNLGYGIRFYSTIVTGVNELSSISNCYFLDCTNGIASEERGEYVNITSCRLHNCTTGVSISGGNVSLIGCNITKGSTGVSLLSGANNSHGIISGCQINHVPTPIKSDGITSGHTITGCHFFQGNIDLKDSIGLSFMDCFVAVTNFWADNCTALFVKSCRMFDGYGLNVDLSKNGNASTVVSQDNYMYNTGVAYTGI